MNLTTTGHLLAANDCERTLASQLMAPSVEQQGYKRHPAAPEEESEVNLNFVLMKNLKPKAPWGNLLLYLAMQLDH